MKFEDWYNGRADKDFIDKPSAKVAFEFAWNAAKEESKPIAKIDWVEYHNGGLDLSYWSFHGCRWHFDTKGEAEYWAIENGYRVV